MQQEMYKQLERMEQEIEDRERAKNGETTGTTSYVSGF